MPGRALDALFEFIARFRKGQYGSAATCWPCQAGGGRYGELIVETFTSLVCCFRHPTAAQPGRPRRAITRRRQRRAFHHGAGRQARTDIAGRPAQLDLRRDSRSSMSYVSSPRGRARVGGVVT